MNPKTRPTEPWRQPRRRNNTTARVQCSTCGAEPGRRCSVSTGGATRRYFHKARVRSAAAARNGKGSTIRTVEPYWLHNYSLSPIL